MLDMLDSVGNILVFAVSALTFLIVSFLVALVFVVSPPYSSINFAYNIDDNKMTDAEIKQEIDLLDRKIKRNFRVARVAMLLSVLVWWPGAFFSDQRYYDATNTLRQRRERLVELYDLRR